MKTDESPLNKRLMSLTELDDWTAGDACEGTLITGSPGSGKSSTAAKEMALRFLGEGMGGLVLCHKADEPDTWLKYCARMGRSKDVILFSINSGHMYDPLYYEWNRPGKGAADVESLIEMLVMLMGGGKASAEGKFWEDGNKKLMRHSIKLIGLAREPLSVETMNRVITSLPHAPGEHESPEFMGESYCGQLFARINERGQTEGFTKGEWGDLAHAMNFLLKKWPRLAPETSSSIEMHWDVLADQLLFDPFRTLFCSGKCTFLPEHTTHAGKIVIVAFPTLEYGETGSLINRLMKVSFQKAWLRRDVTKYPAVAFCFQDEFQTFLMKGSYGASWDNSFQQVCRSARIANVCITQNILNLSEIFGEDHPGSKTKAFLGNLMLRIMHQQNDVDTNTYCADLIGKEYLNLGSMHVNGYNPSFGSSEHLEYQIQPTVFSGLKKPSGSDATAEAIVYWGGRGFRATVQEIGVNGKQEMMFSAPKNFIKRLFSRDI
jgi:hypothetical protein